MPNDEPPPGTSPQASALPSLPAEPSPSAQQQILASEKTQAEMDPPQEPEVEQQPSSEVSPQPPDGSGSVEVGPAEASAVVVPSADQQQQKPEDDAIPATPATPAAPAPPSVTGPPSDAAAVTDLSQERKDDGLSGYDANLSELEEEPAPSTDLFQVSQHSSLHPIPAVMRRQHILQEIPKEGTLADLLTQARESIVTKPWHLLDTREVQKIVALPSTKRGIDGAQAGSRRLAFGDNKLPESEGKSLLSILIGNFFNPITLILGCVFAIGIANQEYVEAVAVVIIILINSGIGAKQEYEAEKAMSAIRKLGGDLNTTVIRDGKTMTIPVDDLVIGDVVEVRQGDQLPADIRLVAVSHLEVDEAVLTGESIPVAKTTAALIPNAQQEEDGIAIGDRINMAFRQTAVTQGYGAGIVVAIGPNSEMGRIASRLKASAVHKKSPLLRSMDHLFYGLVVLGLVFGFFIIWAFDWNVNTTSLMYASATLVAIIPEALLVMITVTLALGSWRMLQNHAIVRKMQALEMLGKVTDVCSDKTGTLTQGKMRPSEIVFFDSGGKLREVSLVGPALHRETKWFEGSDGREINLGDFLTETDSAKNFNSVLMVCSLCSSTTLDIDEADGLTLVGSGNPTEVALQEFVHKAAHSLVDDTGHWLGEEVDDSKSDLQQDETSAGIPGSQKQAALVATSSALRPHLSASRRTMRALQREVSVAEGNLAKHFPVDIGVRLRDDWEFRGEWGFDSTVKRMSTGWRNRDSGRCIVMVKGAPEKILPLCVMEEEQVAEITGKVQTLARTGLRVLGLARRDDVDLRHRNLPDIERDEVEQNLTFVGLVGVRDPPKPESKDSVKMCMTAGITVRMLTGDHLDTAFAISKEIGILPPEADLDTLPKGIVISGPRLDNMTDEELDALEELPLVVARSSPESKVKVVEALHRRQRIVAMTGDGVNDSPSISEADIGIAMGIAGSDVTKNVSDIVLADDNFATIVHAIREGRRIFDAMIKFVLFLMIANVAEAFALMLSLGIVLDRDDVPVFVLSPIAILVVNSVSGFGPSLGLALDKEAPDLMQRPPVDHGIFTWEVLIDLMVLGSVAGALSLGAFLVVSDVIHDGDLGSGCNTSDGINCDAVLEARAAAFLTLNTLILLGGFTCRHLRHSAFSQSWFNNKALLWGFVGGTVLLIPMLYIPGLDTEVFKHRGSGWEWALTLVSCVIFQDFAEFYKWLKRRYLPDPTSVAEKTPNATICRSIPPKSALSLEEGKTGETEMAPLNRPTLPPSDSQPAANPVAVAS